MAGPASLSAVPMPNPYGIGPGEVHQSSLDVSPPRPRAQAANAIPPAVRQAIYRETDARFWAQTHYKPGHSIDPSNAADKHWLPVYYGIGNQVEREWRSGALSDPNAPGWTYKHPIVQAALDQAAASSAQTAASMAKAQEAIRAGDHEAAAQHADAAHAAHIEMVQAARTAAAIQPNSVSPSRVRFAVHRVLHFHMNAAGVGQLDPADAAAAMQAADAPATADMNAAPGEATGDAAASTAMTQATTPEVRGAAMAWSSTPTIVKVGLGIAAGLGLWAVAAKSIGERRARF